VRKWPVTACGPSPRTSTGWGATPSAAPAPGSGCSSSTRTPWPARHRLGAAGTASPTGGALTLSLPARSATLAVLDLEAPPAAASYYTLTPCRLIDTRNAAGPYGGPALSAGERTFNLAGTCGIPTTAQALAVNLTVVAPAQGGDLRAFAAGSAAPLASALNFGAGQTRTNNAILPVTTDGNGGLTVHLDMGPGTAQLIADVFGYFQ
jgi:hypothetical protein